MVIGDGGPLRYREVVAQYGVDVKAIAGLGLTDATFHVGDEVSSTVARASGLRQHGPSDGLGQLGQNRLQAPDYGLEQADAVSEGAVYVGFHGALVVEVDDTDGGVGLTDPIDATDALLDPHGVPRHVRS